MSKDADILREIINYDKVSGLFTWIKAGPRRKVGAVTGHKTKDGYVVIGFCGKVVKAHRLAWLYMTGEWPKSIDHIDGNGYNNSWENLRLCEQSQNVQNLRKSRSDNKVGLLGVSMRQGKYIAQIRHSGKSIHIGCFDNPSDAHIAYLNKKRELHEFCTI